MHCNNALFLSPGDVLAESRLVNCSSQFQSDPVSLVKEFKNNNYYNFIHVTSGWLASIKICLSHKQITGIRKTVHIQIKT